MSFFQKIEEQRILERHSARIEGLELNQARKMIKEYKRAKNELINQLLITPDDTFTEVKLNDTLEKVNVMIRLLEQRVKGQIVLQSETAHEQGIEDSVKEVNRFEKEFTDVFQPIPLDPIMEASDPDTFLFNKFEASLSAYNESMRNNMQQFLTQSLLQNKTWGRTVREMEMAMGMNEYRVARIVRTELHQIYNVAKNKGFLEVRDQYLSDLKKTLYHPLDSRTAQDSKNLAQQNPVVDIDKPFVYTFRGVRRSFMTPPERPNDRAILIPFRESYDN